LWKQASIKENANHSINFNFADIQTKLKVSQADNAHEQEADRVAKHVLFTSITFTNPKFKGLDRK
jgi:hypothetical protein